MEAVTRSVIDKSKWGEGPWLHEPDLKLWTHAGLPCLIARHSALGALGGYVGVPKSHVWDGWSYEEVEVVTHGGLTFSGLLDDHVPEVALAYPAHWWFGFDCMHLGDYCPAMSVIKLSPPFAHISTSEGSYRPFAYVEQVTEHLAEQLASQPRWSKLRAYIAAIAVLALLLGWLANFVHEVTTR